MSNTQPDIVIIGAGIAGLWLHARLRKLGYDSLLLESKAIGSGQTVASQGIIHSGLKYAFAGKINKLAQNISAMPDRWRAALDGTGDIDLSGARVNANSQFMLIPSGFMGGLIKLVTTKALGDGVHDIAQKDWPKSLKQSGFQGRAVFMGEPVLDIPSVIQTLADQHSDTIRQIGQDTDPFEFLEEHHIEPKKVIFTAASSNARIAQAKNHHKGLNTQARPLLMGFLKPAPFEFHAHLVGASDKPLATITTHKMMDGTLVWYLGGGVAERAKEANPQDVIDAIIKGFAKYLPQIDLSDVEWATLPIDRIEGKSEVDGWMPDTPTIHSADNVYYCWPTKLTFAPLLADRIEEKLQEDGINPSHQTSDYSLLPEAPVTQTPWDTAIWTKQSLAKRA